MYVASIVDTTWTAASTEAPRSGSSAAFTATLAVATGVATDTAPDPVAVARQAIGAFDLTRSATDPDAAAAFADGARQVSTAQGLPSGSYDFTRITARQMTIVGGALISAGTIGAVGMKGVLDLAEQDRASTVPINFFAYLHQQAAENEKAPGGMNTAFAQLTSLAALTRVQADTRVPITYDGNYPTAPRDLTVEEINAKLKAAIGAFRTEAARTPAQRIRCDVLKDMKISEDDLKTMPPADREIAEKKVGEEVVRRLTLLGLAVSDGRETAEASDSLVDRIARGDATKEASSG